MTPTISADPRQQIQFLEDILQPTIEEAQALYVRSIFAREVGATLPRGDWTEAEVEERVDAVETVAFDLDSRARSSFNNGPSLEPWKSLIWPAFRIRRALSLPNRIEVSGADPLEGEFLAALDGVVANRQPEIRHRLDEVDLAEAVAGLRWDKGVSREVRRAFLLCVRKRKTPDADDLAEVRTLVAALRSAQPQREVELAQLADANERGAAAARCLAAYNALRAIELLADYLLTGVVVKDGRRLTDRGLKGEIEKHAFNARELLGTIDASERMIYGRLERACLALVDASVYSLPLPRAVRDLVNRMALRDERPIREFWFAQRAAINSRLLDPTRNAIVLSLPTSAGKTLLAEMAIVHASADSPGRRIVYLAPTRALVTQASLTLKRDLGPSGFRVVVATPVFELDPLEEELLREPFDILVTTPEKLDLLVRTGHESLAELAMVVVDEAHLLGEGERGARLELLLSTLRRERVGCKFLLMTPFAQNAADLAYWLGGEQGAPIYIDWKPNDRVVGAVTKGRRHRGVTPLHLRTLSSPHSDCRAGVELGIGRAPVGFSNTKERLAIETALRWSSSKLGGVLVLAESRRVASARAKQIGDERAALPPNAVLDLVSRYLDTESGVSHPMSSLLPKGVAFHHAGLSGEAKFLVERLVENGDVQIICATTTLAHGVHFPLSAAIIESFHRRELHHGRWSREKITPAEFWNIAGRVGRTMEDSMGTIGFVARNQADIDSTQRFLDDEAREVRSALMEMFPILEGIEVEFSIAMVEEHRAMSAFLQYVLHAIAVSGQAALREDAIEELIRGSFAFSEANRAGQQTADEMVRLARSYSRQLVRAKGGGLAGFAKLSDGTGFSSPSVDLMLAEWRGTTREIDWGPQALFREEGQVSDTLVRVMDTLGKIPEIRLGYYDEGQFSPERVARIATQWVNGETIATIAAAEYRDDLLQCTKDLHSTVATLVPWGMRGIQRIAFAGQEVNWASLELLPAMVVHGVRSREAIALRMLGVPRFAAEGLSAEVRAGNVSFAALHEWLVNLPPARWQRALPGNSGISGSETKRIWQALDGQLGWAGLRQSAGSDPA